MGQSHRQTEAQQFAPAPGVRRCPAGERPVAPAERTERQIGAGSQAGQPGDRHVRHRATDNAERLADPPLEGQPPGQQRVQRQAGEPDAHQHPRPAQPIAEGIEGAIEERGRQSPGEQPEIGGDLVGDDGIDADHPEQPLRIPEEYDAGHGEDDGQPETLLQHPGDLAVALRPVQLGDHRRHRLQDADQREDHRNLDAAANGDGGQVGGADMAEDDGVDHHHADGRKLGNQDRQGMGRQAPGSGEKHGERLSHVRVVALRGAFLVLPTEPATASPADRRGQPAKTRQIDLAQAAPLPTGRKFPVQEEIRNE